MTSPAVVAESHGRVALVRLDRPRALGALNSEMLGELDGVVADLSTRPSTRIRRSVLPVTPDDDPLILTP